MGEVKSGWPWDDHAHQCERCGHWITESEWDICQDNN